MSAGRVTFVWMDLKVKFLLAPELCV